MWKYLIFICTMFLKVTTFAQQPANEKQPIVQISSGYSRQLKHNLDGFSMDITGIKNIGKQWFLHYGGGFQQYWSVDKRFDQFLNSFDASTLQLIELAPLRLQTAGIQLQAGIGRNITRYLSFGMNILGRYQGTSVPESYVVVDVSSNMGSGAQIIDPGYRIDNSPEQQLTAGTNCYLLYSPWSKKWWLPGIKLIWQSDLKNNTLLSTHFNWSVKFQ